MSARLLSAKSVRLELQPGLDDLSGVALAGDHLLLGNDEGRHLVICRPGDSADSWQQFECLALGRGDDEIDIEALDFADNHFYVLGSHSMRRKTLKPGELTVERNRERFSRIDRQKSRNRLYRVSFDASSGEVGEADSINLSKRLRKDGFLGPFSDIPSKENGVDIEGLALHRERLYLGFRGPVLRHNLVPVMVLDYDHPKRYELRFVDLRGQGIRDMVSLGDSLILLSGPVGDAAGPFRLWLWDGEDQLPGTDRVVRPVERLGNVRVPSGGKAEGLALIQAGKDSVDLLLVYDGVSGGRAARIRLALPGGH